MGIDLLWWSKLIYKGYRFWKLRYVAQEEWAVFKNHPEGAPGWRSRLSIRLQPGHDLTVREFQPRVRLWADGSQPGACFRFCVSLSLCPSPVHALSLSVSKINKRWKKNFFFKFLRGRTMYYKSPYPPKFLIHSIICKVICFGFALVTVASNCFLVSK